MKTEYVVGFLFNDDKTKVALIEKQKPAWQAGLFNGVGGKVESKDEDYNGTLDTALTAMVREFLEETDVLTERSKWRHYAIIEGNDYIVYCFTQCDSFAMSKLRTVTIEKVTVVPVADIPSSKSISNIPWLVFMAMDENMGNPPFFAKIDYTK